MEIAKAEDPGRRPPRLLAVDAWLPTPDRDAASYRMMQLLRIFRRLPLETTFGVDAFSAGRADALGMLQAEGIEVIDHAVDQPVVSHLREKGERYDLVLLSRAHVARRYVDEVRRLAPRAKLVFDTTDLSFLRGIRAAKVTGNANLMRQALEAKRDELYAARRSDITLVVSEAEREILIKECPGIATGVVSLIQEARGSTPQFAGRQGVIFMGPAAHLPNLDAILYLCSQVRPILARDLPGIKLRIVGANPPEAVRQYASDNCLVMGHVPDLTAWLDRSLASVAPLRFGAGVKGKLLTSMAHGLPVVASSIAIEGIPARDGRDVLVADDPDAIARKIAALHRDEGLWSELSRNGLGLVERSFSPTVARDAVRAVLRSLDVSP
jgi:glycosyltransferase involved in cell wall biosynthesis